MAAYNDLEARAVLSSTESEAPVSRGPGRLVKVAGAVSAALALAGVAAWSGSRGSQASASSVTDYTGLAEVVSQKNWSVTHKERDLCSTIKENCFTTKCCKTAGMHCISTGPGMGQCKEMCPKGKPCTVLTEAMTFDTKPHLTMYCFAVYVKDNGSPKKSWDLELLQQQKAKKVSIFACEDSDVFSDVAVDIGGVSTHVVTDVDHDWHIAKRKHTGTWTNAGIFMQIWKKIGELGKYTAQDWTVKVDADAVFFPAKLKNRIQLMPVGASGAFLQNCEHVDYGFFGNLEVMSKTAFSILLANIDTCKHNIVSNWKIGIKNGKYGPMGEDLFAQICMEKNGVYKVDAFDISQDGMCPSKRPENMKKSRHWHADCAASKTSSSIHPLKTPEKYFACMEAAA